MKTKFVFWQRRFPKAFRVRWRKFQKFPNTSVKKRVFLVSFWLIKIKNSKRKLLIIRTYFPWIQMSSFCMAERFACINMNIQMNYIHMIIRVNYENWHESFHIELCVTVTKILKRVILLALQTYICCLFVWSGIKIYKVKKYELTK